MAAKQSTSNNLLTTTAGETTTFSLEQYVQAATRKNTARSYRSSIEHYEMDWGGFLPATADQVARYLADYAQQLSQATLKQRLAALAAWHKEQGFPDPTKAPLVKKVFKGIRELHPSKQKTATPLQIEQLQQVVDQMNKTIHTAEQQQNRALLLTTSRNRALLLIGFWRGFRSDELCRMNVENTQASANEGIRIYLPRTKTDRQNSGQTYLTPALTQLCPVEAYIHWLQVSGLEKGAVFQAINRWGQLSGTALHPNSLIPMLRQWLEQAGINAETFSSHSLRRGFATWANANQWDIKALMEYIGWKDVKSAMRYIEVKAPFHNAIQSPAVKATTELKQP